MTTATVTARDLFSFVREGDVLITRDGTEYVISGDEHGPFFLRADAFEADVEYDEADPEGRRNAYAEWCSAWAPSLAHEDELEQLANELDADIEAAVDADIEAAAAEGEEAAGVYGITDGLGCQTIADRHNVSGPFVGARARELGVPVLG